MSSSARWKSKRPMPCSRAQFEQMRKMMKMMRSGGLAKMMRGMKGILPGMR